MLHSIVNIQQTVGVTVTPPPKSPSVSHTLRKSSNSKNSENNWRTNSLTTGSSHFSRPWASDVFVRAVAFISGFGVIQQQERIEVVRGWSENRTQKVPSNHVSY